MGLFDSVTQFFQDNVQDAAGNAGETIQNVTDGASNLFNEGGVQEVTQNVTEQVGEQAQPVQDAAQGGQEWVDKLTGNSEE